MRPAQMLLLCLLAIGCAEARADPPVPAPRVQAGDDWTYRSTVETRANGYRQSQVEVTVVRATPSSILISSRPAGANVTPNEQMVGADWSRFRNVNGKEVVVNRPLAFPLSPGRSWRVEYAEANPNRLHSSQQWRSEFRVVGWEEVTVPAGTFRALRIEAEGQWTAVLAPSVSAGSGARVDAQGSTVVTQTRRTGEATVTGRTYKAFWYVPEVRRWVRSVEEYYDSNGARNERYSEELVAFRPAG